MKPLPLTLDEVTVDWLDAALASATPGTRVAAVEEAIAIRGMATKLRLRLRYSTKPPQGPPEQLCLKGGFDEELRAIVGPAYCVEADFYSKVAPRLDLPLPRCWFAASEPQRGQGLIILDDLAAEGARFGEPMEPWEPAEVAAALEVQARWHGPTWGATRAQYPWMQDAPALRSIAPWLLDRENWTRTMAAPVSDLFPTSLRDAQRIHRALNKRWAQDDAAVCALAHVDPHIGNTYFNPSGQPRFIDWQSVHIAPPIDDVAYFLVGAMEVDVRRRHERELLFGYLDAFQRYGGPRIEFDAFWDDYRRHQLHGFLWAVTPPTMQPMPRVKAMAERHLAAIVDHDTMRLVEND